ncbi:MAG TPA: phenylacetic acid degradation bifunctional protein PaaZ [Candidatus Saccharimonadales bacterium]|nr:phenylacetic acid degradation bifunctional protein PaaZ [Candidatus Saccharimonadales bacterium]
MLASYVAGAWHTAPDEGVVVVDAATGDPVAHVSATGLDAHRMVDHARRVGGPALRRLTFQERAAALRELATYLDAHKPAYHDLSLATGATRRDATGDIDGGIGTTFVFSSRGKRELPEGHLLADGDVEPIGKGGTFVGQHVYTPIPGVALQVNAFNFPVWGMLEKLAPAVLAGVPTIVKPATQTAYLTAAVVRDIIDSGALPEGALQLVCGGAGGLLDLLGGEDVIAFTGSAGTAAVLRGSNAVTRRAARFNAETDSLNCSILGPDAVAGTPEFDLYVKEIAREITTKAGQRCTCIRRALVPESLVDDVIAAVRARLDKVVVGNPRNATVTMGALVSLQQRDEVRDAVASLRRAAQVVYGDSMSVDPVDADATSGAFMAPVVLLCNDRDRSEPHEVEAFGPVTTLIPYRAPGDDVSELAVRGGGSLVGSIVSYDPDFVATVVAGAAPHHGRLLILDRDCAGESTGHGTPMPQLVHGGPGRAGGGEELGGMRAVKHFMQRTALQGSPGVIAALISGR